MKKFAITLLILALLGACYRVNDMDSATDGPTEPWCEVVNSDDRCVWY